MLAMIIYILIMYYYADANFNRQNPSLLEDLRNNKTTKKMANIDHYHGDEIRHMWGPLFWFASSHFFFFFWKFVLNCE